MKREEAIEFGKMWLELQEDCKNSNTYEFFKMAIEALQQEPTYTSEVAQKAYEDGKKDGYIQRKIEKIDENDLRVDCISRKAVIDAIYANSVWENEYNLTSSSIKKAVENLPSITPQEPCKDVVSRSEIKRIAKEMYLEVANMEFDVKTISDCISCTSSKCREVFESKLQALPPVKKQEPMLDKPHIKGDYYDGFKNGLRTAEWKYGKIRKEIKKLPITDTAIRLVEEIFDKYMDESEVKE